MANRPTPEPTPDPMPETPAATPSLPEVPNYEWHEGEPPPIDTRKNKDVAKIDWSMLMGIASTRPGRWLKRPGAVQHVAKVNRTDGFEAVRREGIVYLRAIPPNGQSVEEVDWTRHGE